MSFQGKKKSIEFLLSAKQDTHLDPWGAASLGRR
jgi:hypothetical protein